jgi:hypothetical protein
MSEFESAVSASRMTAPVVKNYGDAPSGGLGMTHMGTQGSASYAEFQSGVSATRSGDACTVKNWGNAPSGTLGGANAQFGGGQDMQAYTPGSEFHSAVGNTRSGCECPTHDTPDASGGGLGRS